MENELESFDITPQWSGILPWMLNALEDGDTPEGAKKGFRSEILRLGAIMDGIIAERKEAEVE
jgi:hypothetical protein